MFTSRAEHRLLLRQDNADQRLTPLGHELGLATDERFERLQRKQEALDTTIRALEETPVAPEDVNDYLERVGTSLISEPVRIDTLVPRPQVALDDLLTAIGRRDLLTPTPGVESMVQLVETQLKYAGYLEREQEMVEKMERMEAQRLPEGTDYHSIESITMEAREKLSRIRPDTLGQASRISGVSPADVSALMVLLKSGRLGVTRSEVSRETQGVTP